MPRLLSDSGASGLSFSDRSTAASASSGRLRSSSARARLERASGEAVELYLVTRAMRLQRRQVDSAAGEIRQPGLETFV